MTQLVKLRGDYDRRVKERELAKHIAGEQEDAATAEISKLEGNQGVLLLVNKLVDR